MLVEGAGGGALLLPVLVLLILAGSDGSGLSLWQFPAPLLSSPNFITATVRLRLV